MPFGLFRRWRRRRLARRPMPAHWGPIVEAHFPFAAALQHDERVRFLTRLKVFAAEKHFEGAQGLVVTDEMRVVVAGSAARLARNLPLDVYDGLDTVLLYDAAWKPKDGQGVILGEAHRLGLVVLAWDAVRHGLANPSDGRDTALHEFAHVLDASDGAFDGTPPLPELQDYRAWTRVCSEHFLKLRAAPHKHVLREYGATNEAEFFAVATEAFFEKPEQVRRRAPKLYDELAGYYRVDPIANRVERDPE